MIDKETILCRLRDNRQIEIAIAEALAPLFEGADADDKARVCNLACGLLIDVLAGLDTDKGLQTLWAIEAYAKRSQAGCQNDRTAFFGKGL